MTDRPLYHPLRAHDAAYDRFRQRAIEWNGELTHEPYVHTFVEQEMRGYLIAGYVLTGIGAALLIGLAYWWFRGA